MLRRSVIAILLLVSVAVAPWSMAPSLTATSSYAGPLQTSGVNVALASNGGTATASSTVNSNYPASSTIDGDRKGLNIGAGGTWNDGTAGLWPDWLEVDFAMIQAISEIDVFTIQDNVSNPSDPTLSMTFSLYGITAFSVQYWDGANWVSVPGGDVTGNNNVWRKFTFAAVTTGKIRVYVTNALANYSRIAEVEAWTASQPPTVSITSPASGAVFASVANITINATASDSDGTVSKVEFFQGSTKLGESTTSPYSFQWTGVGVGSYTLTAKATDNSANAAISSAVNISVTYQAVTIAGKITRTDGVTAIAGAGIRVLQGTTVSGTATTNATGDYSVTGLSAGTYSVEASAAGYTTQTQNGVVTTGGTTTTVNLNLNAPINYVYDELGRLVGVVDQGGQAAVYSYDSVGNLLSISRLAASQTGIIRFSPTSGPIGTTVTIYGTGFSATASQNTVAFNGTAATVQSSSPSVIVTSVPAGATTGPISITSPSGSVTSGSSFTVADSNGAPTITSFTPSIAAPGSTFTITGTNFESALLNNRVKVNVVDALPSSAAPTSIAATLPVAGSGHVSVTTPLGKAVSTADMFVIQPPYSPADVVSTQRTTIGAAATVSVGTANKIALVLFDGSAGQQVCFNITNGTMSGAITLYNPDGSVLLGNAAFSSSTFIDTLTLPATGTYSALVAPSSSQTGSISFTPINAPDVTATLSAGTQVSLSTTGMGQSIRTTFAGTTGQRVSVQAGTLQACTVSVLSPDGSNLVTPRSIPTNWGGVFVDVTVLPMTGTYAIVVHFTGGITGSALITFWQVPADVTGTITQGGSPVTATMGTPGQNGALTFTGTVGERLALTISNVTIAHYTLSVKKPDGSVLTSTGEGTSFLETGALAVAGQYTIFIDPSDSYTGSITLSLADTPDVTGTLTLDGTALALSTTTPGQNVRGNFNGTAGHRASFIVSSNLACAIYVVNPDGSNLVTTSMPQNFGGIFIEPAVLPVTGAYSLFVDITGTATGSVTLYGWDVPADLTGTVTVGGSAVPLTLGTPGQNGSLTFSGTSGQQVTVHVTGNTANVTVKLLAPGGTVLTSTSSTSSSFDLATQTLATTGTYTIVIDPNGASTGSMSVSVTSP